MAKKLCEKKVKRRLEQKKSTKVISAQEEKRKRSRKEGEGAEIWEIEKFPPGRELRTKQESCHVKAARRTLAA